MTKIKKTKPAKTTKTARPVEASYQTPVPTITLEEAIASGMTSTQVRAIANSLERIAKSDREELVCVHLYNPKDDTYSTHETSFELRNFNPRDNFRNARALHMIATELRKKGL